jgi:hypothetical protein
MIIMLAEIIVFTLVIEILTIIGRILFGSKQKRYEKIKFKYKLRVHHGYIGVVFVLINLFYSIGGLFIVAASLKSRKNPYLADAEKHFANGNYKDAAMLFEQSIVLSEDVKTKLIHCYAHLGRTDKILQVLEREQLQEVA